jgi:HD-GYP domain-containing protein (c-di-GMP phosphodiesterase class II)
MSTRVAECVAALSIATDLGMGQPLEFALRSCVLSLRLGEALKLSEGALQEVYYQALLRYIGCNVETDLLAAIVGDEMGLRRDFARIDNASTPEIFQLFYRFIRQANRGASTSELVRALAGGMLALPEIKASFAGHCEVAQRLADRLGFDGNIIYALGQLYERWDGKGAPHGIKGEAIAPAVRVVSLAQDMLLFYQLNGLEASLAIARQRRGAAYAPAAVDVFCSQAGQLFSGLEELPAWESVLDLEPGEQRMLDSDAFDRACEAMADFVDIKSPSTLGHSSGVASTARQAAKIAGLPETDALLLYRAGLLHDLGKTGVSSRIWEKPGALTAREWEQVRLHAYYTERILSHSVGFAGLAALAGLHHERLDGSGYHRGLPGSMLAPQARILAAADVFQALRETRPHRAAVSMDQAAAVLQVEVHKGRLDGEAVRAVLAAAGKKSRKAHPELAAGLSEREVEVLRLLARGRSTRQVGEALVISTKTADHHIQNIYTKIGVSTRAGATLWAMEHQLIESPEK